MWASMDYNVGYNVGYNHMGYNVGYNVVIPPNPPKRRVWGASVAPAAPLSSFVPQCPAHLDHGGASSSCSSTR